MLIIGLKWIIREAFFMGKECRLSTYSTTANIAELSPAVELTQESLH